VRHRAPYTHLLLTPRAPPSAGDPFAADPIDGESHPDERIATKGVASSPRTRATPLATYVRVDFGRQRRLRMGLLAALPKRYVRCVVDVNDVDLRVSRSASVSAPQRSTPALSRRRQTAPACWRELAERATPACPCPHRRLAESSAALADLTAAAVAPSLIAPLTFPTSRRAGFFRFLRTSSMRSGWSLGPSRRTHVNDVKSQQPRGVTTPTSHKSPQDSSGQADADECSATIWIVRATPAARSASRDSARQPTSMTRPRAAAVLLTHDRTAAGLEPGFTRHFEFDHTTLRATCLHAGRGLSRPGLARARD
jgi:hypothetical protein